MGKWVLAHDIQGGSNEWVGVSVNADMGELEISLSNTFALAAVG
jgi:hypothetical protein